MLADELPPRTQAIAFCQIKHKERAELDRQTQEFLNRGNKIDELKSGFNPPLVQISKELQHEQWHSKINDAYTRLNNSLNRKPTGHQNIFVHSKSGYYVQIGACFAGRRDTIEECQKLRDIKRKEMRLTPAVFK